MSVCISHCIETVFAIFLTLFSFYLITAVSDIFLVDFISVYLVRYSGRRLPPVTQVVPKLPAVNEGGVIVDDIGKGDSGCVAIQQLYEDMRTDWTTRHHREKSAKNGLDRTIQPVGHPSTDICLSHIKCS